MILLIIAFLIVNLQTPAQKPEKQKEIKIVTCKITFANKTKRSVKCPDTKFNAIFSIAEWPKEWEDSTKVGDKVKVKFVGSDEAYFVLSCEARRKLKLKEYESRKHEGNVPLQLPLDRDCNGEPNE